MSSLKITPMTFDAKWYIWENKVDGAFSKEYKENWGRTYGEQRVNTNYRFNSDSKVLTDSLKTRGAVQSLAWSNMFQSVIGTNPPFPATLFEKVTFIGYNLSGTESQDNDVRPFLTYSVSRIFFNETFPLYDVYDKPQMCDADKKPVDGSGVLLYYVGDKELPRDTSTFYERLRWQITDDDQNLFNLLNDGNPCWDMRGTGRRIFRMPQFSRWDMANGKNLDFGISSELAVPSVTAPSGTAYERHWKRYVEDRYDVDTTIINCKVNLGGLPVGQGLLRNFFWFGNSLWVLSKITNYSLTTFDLAECEFIKVQNTDNYTNGQY